MSFATLQSTETSSTIYSDNGNVWRISYGVSEESKQPDAMVKIQRSDLEISAKLYVSYVKSKLSKVHKDELKRRVSKLQRLLVDAKGKGQVALYEALAKELLATVREQKAAIVGCDKFVTTEAIEKYQNKVKEKPIKFKPYAEFPRTIPGDVFKKFQSIKKCDVFDEFHILYADYSGDNSVKSTKEKIREKDPILFGSLKSRPGRFYYIADWVDEYCDLTFDKFVTQIRLDDSEYAVSKVEAPSKSQFERMLKQIEAELSEKEKKLKSTNSSNFRGLMQSVDDVSWWQRSLRLLRRLLGFGS